MLGGSRVSMGQAYIATSSDAHVRNRSGMSGHEGGTQQCLDTQRSAHYESNPETFIVCIKPSSMRLHATCQVKMVQVPGPKPG